MHDTKRTDRRSRKTDAMLRRALSDLIREKPYHQIAVKEILNRADVGRSTFYTHFCGKGDLLLSCIHEVVGAAEPEVPLRVRRMPHEALIGFSRPILDHIESHRRAGGLPPNPGGRQEIHEHLRQAIVDRIEGEVADAFRAGVRTEGTPSPELLARWISSTFVLVLEEWVAHDNPVSAAEADRRFRALVEPALARAVIGEA